MPEYRVISWRERLKTRIWGKKPSETEGEDRGKIETRNAEEERIRSKFVDQIVPRNGLRTDDLHDYLCGMFPGEAKSSIIVEPAMHDDFKIRIPRPLTSDEKKTLRSEWQ